MGIGSEDFPLFSRNEPTHPLLDALAENDKEDELLFRDLERRERMLP